MVHIIRSEFIYLNICIDDIDKNGKCTNYTLKFVIQYEYR